MKTASGALLHVVDFLMWHCIFVRKSGYGCFQVNLYFPPEETLSSISIHVYVYMLCYISTETLTIIASTCAIT